MNVFIANPPIHREVLTYQKDVLCCSRIKPIQTVQQKLHSWHISRPIGTSEHRHDIGRHNRDNLALGQGLDHGRTNMLALVVAGLGLLSPVQFLAS
ncbi:MAG TPA: hypothetical protein D7H78_01820, partial [Candidatus Poseidoniales archaeon]